MDLHPLLGISAHRAATVFFHVLVGFVASCGAELDRPLDMATRKDASVPELVHTTSLPPTAASDGKPDAVIETTIDAAVVTEPQSIPRQAADAGTPHFMSDHSAAEPPQSTAAPATVGRSALGATALPCALQAVVEVSCQGCHASQPGALAPMALTTLEDLLAPAVSQPGRKVYELMRERIHSQVAPMPPTSSRSLTAHELDVLDLQLLAAASGTIAGCDNKPTEPEAWPDPDPEEIEQCYPFRAHSANIIDPSGPYRVPSGEIYACFVFDIPWQAEAQALTIRSHNSPVVHHWLLSDEVENIPAGTVIAAPSDCGVGVNTVYGVFAVSKQQVLNMPPTVGLQMPSAGTGLRMMLGVHYYNLGAPVDDTSGADVCVARKPRPNNAGVHIVGAQDLMLPPRQMTDVTTTCTPTYQGDIHIVRTLPHMHRNGVHFDTTIVRADGARSPLVELPFDFNNQLSYQSDAIMHAGDTLITTCQYQNKTDRVIRGGESTDDEMCVNFITAWPAGSLLTGRNRAGASACFE